MNAIQWMKTVGHERAAKVIKAAGTTPEYFRRVYKGFRRPSVGLANRLADCSHKESAKQPDHMKAEMTVSELLLTDAQLAKYRAAAAKVDLRESRWEVK